MNLQKDNYNVFSIPYKYLNLSIKSTKELLKIFFDYSVNSNILSIVYSLLCIRNEFGMEVFEYFKNIDFSDVIKYMSSYKYSFEFKKYFLKLYKVPYYLSKENIYDFFNNDKIPYKLKKYLIDNNKSRFSVIDYINTIENKNLRLYFYEKTITKENVLKVFSNKDRIKESLIHEFLNENISTYYDTIKKGNTKKLLIDALFVYEDENLLSTILKIKKIEYSDIKNYIDKDFALKALGSYKKDKLLTWNLVNNNYGTILSNIKNITYLDFQAIYASNEGMEIILSKTNYSKYLRKWSITNVVSTLSSSVYSETLKKYLVSIHKDLLIKYYIKFPLETILKDYKYILLYDDIAKEIYKKYINYDNVIDLLNNIYTECYYNREEIIKKYYKLNRTYFNKIIDETDFALFSSYSKYKINSLKKDTFEYFFDIYHDEILEKYKMINTSILEEIVHNDKENDVIKDFAYEALYPDKVDRECIKEITKYFGYSKDDDYYSTLKTFLNNINFDIKLFIQYGLNNDKTIFIMNDILKNNEVQKFLKLKKFIENNYSFIINDANKVESLCKILLSYYKYKNLFNNIDYLALNKNDIQNIYLLINDKTDIISNCPNSIELLDKMIKEKFALLKKHVNECDNKLELNQIFLYLTSFNSEDINTLIHNIGGVTGLETLKANNSKNELLCYYIDEIIKVIRIKINYNSNTDAIKYILNNILSENDNPIKDLYTNVNKIYSMIRNIYEIEANYNLTPLSEANDLIDLELTKKYGVKTYDFRNVNYCLYAHVKSYNEPDYNLVNGISDGKSNYISLSPISYLGQKYYFDYVTEVFLYDHIPEGSYICSSTVNMGTNHILTKNSYCDVVIDAYQRGIIETSSVSDRNSETLLYRKNLKPVAIALINGKSPSAKELEYAKKYNLSFVMTQKQNSYIDKPVNFFSKKEIKYISDNKKESFYDGLLYLINYHKDDVYTGRKIMIISDIHAFLEPTIALLSYAKTQGITEIYSLGDNITVGPNPKEVLELLEKYNVQSIEGNSESYFLNDYKAFTYFDKNREDNCNWTLDKIGSRVNDLKYYPVSRQITVGNQKVGLIHFGNDVRWDYNNHNTWIFQRLGVNDRAKEFLYTNSLQAKEDMLKIMNTLGSSHPHSKIIQKALNNPMLEGNKITDYNHIFEGHVHFDYEDKLNDTLIHTIKMIFRDDFACGIVLKEKNDGTFEIEPIVLDFNKESMMGKIYSSDMPSKDKALMYTRK